MGIEIERKFLVIGDAWRVEVGRRQRMAQGYLNDAASVDAARRRPRCACASPASRPR